MLKKYAQLLTSYCLNVQRGQTILIRGNAIALPLIEPLHQAVLNADAIPIIHLSSDQLDRQVVMANSPGVWDAAHGLYRKAVNEFDAILTISAPENSKTFNTIPSAYLQRYTLNQKSVKKEFMKRSSTGDLRWALCVYPTHSLAHDAEMATAEFFDFVMDACGLFESDPVAYWLDVRKFQQKIVDHLNLRRKIRYLSENTDITFSVDGRTWINSDGRRNMPSGEVFTSPVETSVNGHITFDFPVIYQGSEMRGIRFTVVDGEIQEFTAQTGQETLDQLMAIPGARRFGEAAIGTNKKIQKHTKNILFDEKIGGTVHMAIGASYPEAGGKNESAIHLDLISDMRNGGQIYADDQLIYESGTFLID